VLFLASPSPGLYPEVVLVQDTVFGVEEVIVMFLRWLDITIFPFGCPVYERSIKIFLARRTRVSVFVLLY
jgi:hypothetical protein